jgi:hypothetical protein
VTAPREAVEAVQKALGCREATTPFGPMCKTHIGFGAKMRDGLCEVAVAAADAAVDALGLTAEWRSDGKRRLVGPWTEAD